MLCCYLVYVEGYVAVGKSLLEIIGKLVQRTDTANVTDHGDVLVPVAGLVVELQSPHGEGDIEAAETVLYVAVHQVRVIPVVQLVVARVGLCLCWNTFREIFSERC